MTLEIALMLLFVAAALVAFVRELFPLEITALGLLGALVLSGLIDVETALSGFSSTAVIAIGSLFVLSRALTKTGLLETVADRLGSAERSPWLMIVLLLAAVCLGSAVLNNTAVIALAIPLVMKLCRRLDLSPSKVMIPLSYASLFGGTLTLIGTSTNLLVASVVAGSDEPPLGLFEFSAAGGLFALAGLAYLVLFARRGLPARAGTGALTSQYRLGGFLTELRVTEDSALAGHTLGEARVNETYGVTVVEMIRETDGPHLVDVDLLPLRPGDLLIVQGELDDIMRLRREQRLETLPEASLDDDELGAGGQALMEAWVAPGSPMIGRTLRELDFQHRQGVFVLAVRRVGDTLSRRVADVRLRVADVRFRFADVLLLLMPRDRVEELERGGEVLVISEHDVHLRRERRWWLVLAVLPVIVLAAALGWLDIAAGALVGAVLLLMARVMTPPEAYRAVDWSVVLMIAAFVPVGLAFQSTGTADLLAGGLMSVSGWVPPEHAPRAALAALYLLTAVLTQVASNSAAAVVATPIALSLGPALGVDARPFVFAVVFAASAAFMTPMGYQTNLMVYAAGQYRFRDYVRFGAPLNLVMWGLAVLVIPVFWPF